MILYAFLKGFFLLVTMPIWVFPWAYMKYRQSRRPKVTVKVYNNR